MYDWPEVAWANDMLWLAIGDRLRAAGIRAPHLFDRSRPPDSVWRDPNLVLSQTCGYPFATRLRGIVKLVAVPVYDVPGCQGATYSSMIIVRIDEKGDNLASFKGRRFAFNAADSLSGYLALAAAMVEAGMRPREALWVETGSHRASVSAVAEGRADVAAIDAVCWALATRFEAVSVAALKVIAETAKRPALPLITSTERTPAEVATIKEALSAALSDPYTAEARGALAIVGLGKFDEWDYMPIAALGRHAS